jgi:cyclophilin family peptidyl-prolyl cis-trans isomerase
VLRNENRARRFQNPNFRAALHTYGELERHATNSMALDWPAAFAELGFRMEYLSGSKGGACPKVGQTVLVRYTGRLNNELGTVFDSTEGKPDFSLRVGRGMVIGGWDAALPHISEGMEVRLTVPAVLAYGAKGKPGLIPPSSTLCFDIRLVSIVQDTPAEQLLDAATTGDVIKLGQALRDGADVCHGDRKGATALHLASAGGHLGCVVRLLEASAAVDAVQNQPAGVTPLMLAVKSSAEPMCAKLLLCAKADPRKQTAKGNSALSLMAADKEYSAIAAECESSTAKAAPAQDGLGIGPTMPAGWEVLRSSALWLAAKRRQNPRCWLKFVVDPAANANGVKPAADGPIVEVELYADVVPLTAENFRCLCTGEKGKCAAFGGPPLHFKGNVAHRIVPGNILQAGDITTGDGKGGESIYGRKFNDEHFVGRAGKHRVKGLLSMANSGRNSNGSQFFITLDAMPHLDGKHVVFGRVTSGMEYVEAIVGVAGDRSGVPARRVVIADCGQL